MHTVALTFVLAIGGLFDGESSRQHCCCGPCDARDTCACDATAPCRCGTKSAACHGSAKKPRQNGSHGSPGGRDVAEAAGHGGGDSSWVQQAGFGISQAPIKETATCQPLHGRYAGRFRFLHGYPPFHGTYYRRPYNYRNLYDYPWHAPYYEPPPMFSPQVPPPEEIEAVEDTDVLPSPPAPLPEAQHRGLPRQDRLAVTPPLRLQPIPVDFSQGKSHK